MRNLIGAVFLAGLLVVLWRVWPEDALAKLAGDADVAQAAQSGSAAPAEGANALRVLFVGNSHTYYNVMPQMIVELAAAAREERPFSFVMETPGGADLAQHVAGGRIAEHLRHGRWDYVVLQEQQQRPAWRKPEQRDREFFAPARTLDVLTRAAGAKTVFYMTWARRNGDIDNIPDDTYDRMQERMREGYTTIARELDAAIAPVGLAWQWAHRERPDLALWIEDGSHATPLGSYLAACVLYAVLYHRSSLAVAYTAGLPDADARFLQRAAEVSLHL